MKQKQMKTPTTQIKTCLNPNCTREAKARGLCLACCQVARKLVKRGGVSWQQLIASNKCLDKARGKTLSWLLDL